MTSRFGRNKRRRAREQIAQQQAAIQAQRAVIDREAMKAHRLAVELQDIRDLVGFSRSFLFPPGHPMAAHTEPTDRVQVVPEFDSREAGVVGMDAEMSFQLISLQSLLAGVSHDVFQRCIHTYVKFEGGEVAYAISKDVLDRMPADGIEHLVRRNIAPLLARKLAAELVKLRRRW